MNFLPAVGINGKTAKPHSSFSDIEIAMAQTPKDIQVLANEVGLRPDELDMYGKKKAKVSLKVLDRLKEQPNGRYVVVTG